MTGTILNVITVLIGGVLGGLRRGLSGELSRVLIAAGCVALIYHYARPLAHRMGPRYDLSADVALLIASAVLLLCGYIVLTVVRLALAAVFKSGARCADSCDPPWWPRCCSRCWPCCRITRCTAMWRWNRASDDGCMSECIP